MITKSIISSAQLTVSQFSSVLHLLYNLDIDFFWRRVLQCMDRKRVLFKKHKNWMYFECGKLHSIYIWYWQKKNLSDFIMYKNSISPMRVCKFENLFWIQKWIPALEWACIFLRDQFYSDLFSWFQLGLFFFESWLVALKYKLFEKYWIVCSQGPLSCKVIEILWASDHEVMHQYLENC